jgi:hypothetical protein
MTRDTDTLRGSSSLLHQLVRVTVAGTSAAQPGRLRTIAKTRPPVSLLAADVIEGNQHACPCQYGYVRFARPEVQLIISIVDSTYIVCYHSGPSLANQILAFLQVLITLPCTITYFITLYRYHDTVPRYSY